MEWNGPPLHCPWPSRGWATLSVSHALTFLPQESWAEKALLTLGAGLPWRGKISGKSNRPLTRSRSANLVFFFFFFFGSSSVWTSQVDCWTCTKGSVISEWLSINIFMQRLPGLQKGWRPVHQQLKSELRRRSAPITLHRPCVRCTYPGSSRVWSGPQSSQRPFFPWWSPKWPHW